MDEAGTEWDDFETIPEGKDPDKGTLQGKLTLAEEGIVLEHIDPGPPPSESHFQAVLAQREDLRAAARSRVLVNIPAVPAESIDIQAALPPGWKFLGVNVDAKRGLVYEAQHRSGVGVADSAESLVALAWAAQATAEAGLPVAPPPPPREKAVVNRRRKRRRKITEDLVRCQGPLCGALVFRDGLVDHLECIHEIKNVDAGDINKYFSEPTDVDDDGTGDNPALDDPKAAMAVKAED